MPSRLSQVFENPAPASLPTGAGFQGQLEVSASVAWVFSECVHSCGHEQDSMHECSLPESREYATALEIPPRYLLQQLSLLTSLVCLLLVCTHS